MADDEGGIPMNWTMTTPCPDCPFRKEGGIPLRRGRIREIGGMMLDSRGGTFPCHRSVDYAVRNEDAETHCAGALIFAEKQGTLPQLARIMGRLGVYDPRKFTDESRSLVWDSLGQWLKKGAK